MSNANSNTSENRVIQTVGQLMSILQATRYVSEVWTSFSAETRCEIEQQWSDLLRNHPQGSLQIILGDIEARSDLRDAWHKLAPEEQATRKQILGAILTQNGF